MYQEIIISTLIVAVNKLRIDDLVNLLLQIVLCFFTNRNLIDFS
jgi:hypothetical protein